VSVTAFLGVGILLHRACDGATWAKVNVVRDSATELVPVTFQLSRIAELDTDLLVMGAYPESISSRNRSANDRGWRKSLNDHRSLAKNDRSSGGSQNDRWCNTRACIRSLP
jgi:hypothetical protein